MTSSSGLLNYLSTMCFESIPNFSDRLDGLLPKCVNDVGDISSIAILLCGLFALFYIGNIVWQSWCKGDPINVYALFRPFMIGIIIVNFSGFVTILDGVCDCFNQPTKVLVHDYVQKNKEFSKTLNKLLEKSQEDESEKQSNPSVKTNVKGLDEQLNQLDPFTSDEKNVNDEGWVDKLEKYLFEDLKEYIASSVVCLLSMISLIVAIGVLMVAFVSKIVLVYLGPFAFALSLIPYFSGSLSNWLRRYITVSLYAPCINIVCFVILSLYNNLFDKTPESAEIGFGWVLMISIASTLSFFAVPSMSSYIVDSVGAGGMTGAGRGAVSKAGTLMGGAKGKIVSSIGKILQ